MRIQSFSHFCVYARCAEEARSIASMALQADRSAYGRMDALVATLNVDTLRQVMVKGLCHEKY
jgi:hypothetical protein